MSKKYSSLLGYLGLTVAVIVLDRVSKELALRYLTDSYVVNSYLSFDLVMNRGISWSLFHSAESVGFVTLSLVIMIIISALMMHTLRKWYAGEWIIGEILTLAGALSNVFDRALYGGVIDFIVLSVGDWTWPVFNIADCSIVLGIAIMFVTLYRK
ncbi:signal peptidase II [Candidatus Dependentiae bacterium]|nr:signal peptidase II [Candidatus Dependentiae bacterium]